ncbi:MAG: RNA 3'-phosphate cyclase [Methanomassiliicoccales archaeon]|nr:RNA 3'-phosphate cyclase [Methanomassiliicoccales archaeon]
MIELDGSIGEGGGQTVRTALSLSALTGEPFHMSAIRAGRPDPGLKPQHLAGVRLMRRLCSAKVIGDDIASQDLEFSPGPLVGGSYDFDVGTAGSLTLMMQTVLPALVLSPINVELALRGGTDVKWSPPIDHYQQVLLPLLRRMGAHVELNVERRGCYPQGGGCVHLKVQGGTLTPLRLETKGELRRVFGTAFAQNLPSTVADRIAESVIREIPGADIRREVSIGPSTGAGVTLSTEYEHTVLGWNALGARGVPSERVGREAALGLLGEMNAGGTLDAHTADQLLPFMALANGDSCFTVSEISGHLETQMALLPSFRPVRFLIKDRTPVVIEVLNRT